MRVNSTSELASLIRRRRRELGLTQTELARRVGASRHWVMELERGKPGVSLEMVLNATAALGLIWDLRLAGASAAGSPNTDAPPAVDLNDIIRHALRPRGRKK